MHYSRTRNECIPITSELKECIYEFKRKNNLKGKGEIKNELHTQLNMANLKESQNSQTAAILANNAAQTAALEQYLNPAPIPAYVVQNPNCCGQTTFGCGCGA